MQGTEPDSPHDYYSLDEAVDDYGRRFIKHWSGEERHKLHPPKNARKREYWESDEHISDQEAEAAFMLGSSPTIGVATGLVTGSIPNSLISAGAKLSVARANQVKRRREAAEQACQDIFRSDDRICRKEMVGTSNRENFEPGTWAGSAIKGIFRTKRKETFTYLGEEFFPVVHRDLFWAAARDAQSRRGCATAKSSVAQADNKPQLPENAPAPALNTEIAKKQGRRPSKPSVERFAKSLVKSGTKLSRPLFRELCKKEFGEPRGIVSLADAVFKHLYGRSGPGRPKNAD